MTDDATVQVQRHYDRTARRYNRQISLFERILFAGGRQGVCSQASGEVLEIAIGTGRTLRHYPPDVRLTGIELSPEMLELARREAASLSRDVELRIGDAQALEFADESFDTVTCTLSLCTIPDDRAAVRRVKRALRPGGRFVLIEHVRSPLAAVGAGERLLEPLFLRLEHDHLTRDPLDYLEDEGFEIETSDGPTPKVAGREATTRRRSAAQAVPAIQRPPCDVRPHPRRRSLGIGGKRCCISPQRCSASRCRRRSSRRSPSASSGWAPGI